MYIMSWILYLITWIVYIGYKLRVITLAFNDLYIGLT